MSDTHEMYLCEMGLGLKLRVLWARLTGRQVTVVVTERMGNRTIGMWVR